MSIPDYTYPPGPLFTAEQSAAIGEAFDKVFPPEPCTDEANNHSS